MRGLANGNAERIAELNKEYEEYTNARLHSPSQVEHPLVGAFFHSFHENGNINLQGQIIEVSGHTDRN
jgi:hypothetical protein